MEIKSVPKTRQAGSKFDFDKDVIYDTETGNTVSEMSFEEVLNKILEEDKNNV